MATGTELERPEDLQAAAAIIASQIRSGKSRDAETAMALYEPKTQALIVRTSFIEALRPRPGESSAAARQRAGREAERVLETVPNDHAAEVVGALEPQVLGALVSSAAGQPHSTVADLVDSTRLGDILASDLDLWTVLEWSGAPGGGPKDLVRKSGINVRHLVHVIWTILQTDDERATAHLQRLNPDLIAFPLALALVERRHSDGRDPDDGSDEESDREDFRTSLLHAEADGPETLELPDGELVGLLDVIYRLSPETYRAILRHAQEMDLAFVQEQLEQEASERASGEDAPASSAADTMFTPLDPPK